MEKKANNSSDNQQLEQKTTPESTELPSLEELGRRLPSLPHEESDDAWA